MSTTQSDSHQFTQLNWAVIGFLVSALALLAGCVYAILYCASGIDTSGHALGSDDAYISYRYAQNLVNGMASSSTLENASRATRISFMSC